METKTMVINCATCDATQVREETLQAYDKVVINAAVILTSAETAPLLHRYDVSMNAANIVTVPLGTKAACHNGKYTITPADAPTSPTLLMVNGSLVIEPGCEQVLSQYVSITVNGSVIYPRSLSGHLGAIKVNGASECYPDDAVMLKRNFVMDKVFLLRAKNDTLYYAARRVVLTDPALDLSRLSAKGVSFQTAEVVVADSLLEQAIPLFDDEVEFTVVPDGTAFVNDDLTLDTAALRRFGPALYVNGDVTLTDPAVPEQITYLKAMGSLRLAKALVDRMAGINAAYEHLIPLRANCICDQPTAKVGRALLEHQDGLTVDSCACVTLAEDIPPQLILERLDMIGCATVRCTPLQRAAVECVCKDVAVIQEIGPDDDLSPISACNDIITGRKKVINAAEYQL